MSVTKGGSEMMRVIKVYGKLAKHLGQRSFKAVARTPEARLSNSCANFPSLRSYGRANTWFLLARINVLAITLNTMVIRFDGQSHRIAPVVSGAGARCTTAIQRLLMALLLLAQVLPGVKRCRSFPTGATFSAQMLEPAVATLELQPTLCGVAAASPTRLQQT